MSQQGLQSKWSIVQLIKRIVFFITNKKVGLLLLGGVQRFGGLLGLLFTNANQSSIGASATKSVVGVELLLLLCWNTSLLGTLMLNNRQNGISELLGLADLFHGRFTLSDLFGVQWEQDESRAVLLKTSHILLNRLDRSILSSIVDLDANSWCKLSSNTGRFQLIKRKATTKANLIIVSDGGTMHQRPKFLRGPRCHEPSFGYTCIVALLLAKWLIEPALDETLPILVKVGVGYKSVTLSDHFGLSVPEGSD